MRVFFLELTAVAMVSFIKWELICCKLNWWFI